MMQKPYGALGYKLRRIITIGYGNSNPMEIFFIEKKYINETLDGREKGYLYLYKRYRRRNNHSKPMAGYGIKFYLYQKIK